MDDYAKVNRKAWALLAKQGCDSSLPYGPKEFQKARQWLDESHWIPWKKIRSVLCLACGGGQQAPLFGSLGYRVTVADISPEQLAIDRDVAKRYNLPVECVELDMLDLSPLYGRDFDLVYQAISACYVPDVRKLYREVHRVLKSDGHYRVDHWNPVHLQLSDSRPWDGNAYRISRTQSSGEPVGWAVASDERSGGAIDCWHYFHPLDHLIGGLCDAGFTVLQFAERGAADLSAEPGTHLHLAAFLPSFFSLFARRRP